MSASPGPPAPARSPAPFLLLAAAGLLVVAIGALVVGLAVWKHRQRVVSRSGVTAPLDQEHSSRNGLLTAHFPSDFAATDIDGSTVMIERNLGVGNDEPVNLAVVMPVITPDVKQFAARLLLAKDKKIQANGGKLEELSRTPDAVCFQRLRGLKIESRYVTKFGTEMRISSCYVVEGSRGYKFETMLPVSVAQEDRPLLDRIVAATQLASH